MEMMGNVSLLTYTKVGFLASSHINVTEVMACYEWASRKQKPGTAVISGFSSKMERDVLHFLLKVQTPVIWVLARRPYQKLPVDLQEAFDANRLLVISISQAARQSRQSALRRNQYVAEKADKLIFTGVTATSSLCQIVKRYSYKIIDVAATNKEQKGK